MATIQKEESRGPPLETLEKTRAPQTTEDTAPGSAALGNPVIPRAKDKD
jgi:hypothetical protein